MKVVINTSTFGTIDRKPLDLLEKEKINYSLNPFKRQLTAEEVVEICKDSVGIIAGTEPLTKDVLSKLNKLKVISRCGAGMDNVDLFYAKEKGIKVGFTPFGPTVAVAELTIGLILTLLRQKYLMNEQLKSGQWNKVMGNLLYGKNVGIIGFGRIGRKVSELLSVFGVRIAYNDLQKNEGFEDICYKDLDDLLGWSDIVCVHVSKSNETRYILDEKEFSLMKKGSWLVNCSRGGVVNEQSLYESLVSGRLSGAAIDVFEKEPYCGPLINLKNVVLTPHIGSYAKEARVEMEIEAVNNLINGLKE